MNHKTFVPLFCIVALVLASCVSSEQPVQETLTAEASSYFSGEGGKGISLAILAPKTQGLADTQDYIPALIQGEFVSNFT
ncbi:hypothetical protein LQZ19_13175, partial [Treponema primitia]|uniref:hypothetical protein n=1 Tax=Treponema primitia TaxID=88058 RepID=UPI0039801594